MSALPPVKVRRILVPVDGSRASLHATKLAAEMARALGAEMTVLHVLPVREFPVLMAEAEGAGGEEEAQLVLGEAVQVARAQGIAARVLARRGHVVDQILRATRAYGPELIVMGSRGLTGAKGVLLGSVSQAVARRSRTTVVLVK